VNVGLALSFMLNKRVSELAKPTAVRAVRYASTFPDQHVEVAFHMVTLRQELCGPCQR